jgi:hypothetical protein
LALLYNPAGELYTTFVHAHSLYWRQAHLVCVGGKVSSGYEVVTMSEPNSSVASIPPDTPKDPDDPAFGVDRTQFARTVPYYFAALAGLIYAAGFLIEFSFMNSLGVEDSLVESIKAKHIYIGVLCLFFPVSVILIVLAISRLRRNLRQTTRLDDKLRYRMYIPNSILFTIFLAAFYGLIGIARPSTFSEHEVAFGLLFLLALLSPSIVHLSQLRILRLIEEHAKANPTDDRELEQTLANRVQDVHDGQLARELIARVRDFDAKRNKDAKSIDLNALGRKALFEWNFAVLLLYGIVIVAFYLISRIFWDLGADIREMLSEGGYLHYCLLALAGFLAWRGDVSRQRQRLTSPESRTPGALMNGILITALVYLSVLFFASRVYCYIPVYKGGGDFTTESPSIIHFDPQAVNSLPAELLAAGAQSKPLFIIHQNSDMFFLALPTQTNNPRTWRHVGHTNKPERIFVVQRKTVSSYQLLQSH